MARLRDDVQLGLGIGLINSMAGLLHLASDPFGQLEKAEDLNAFAAQVRTRPLVTSRVGALHFTARHDIATQVLRSPDVLSAAFVEDANWLQRLILNPMRMATDVHPLLDSLIAKDGIDHARLRKLAQPAFTHRASQKWRAMTRQVAEQLVDDFPTGGSVDLVRAWAAPLPMAVICELLGVPFTDRELFSQWGDAMAVGLDRPRSLSQGRAMNSAAAATTDYLTELIAERRRAPGEDLLSALANSEVDGDHLSDREVVATAGFLLIAGFETTVNLLGAGTRELLRHPDQLELVLSDPQEHTSNLVEEALRYVSPVQFTFRRLVEPLELHDPEVPDGVTLCEAPSEIVVMLGGANRDPAVFSEPEKFDITRTDARKHIAFGYGAHMCLGAALARMEAEVAWQVLFERYPNAGSWREAGPAVPTGSRILNGLASLPVTLG